MDKKLIDFCAKRKTFIIIPSVIFAVALVVLLIFGLEVSIEFKGGTMLTYSYTGELDADAVASTVNDMGHGFARVTKGSSFATSLETITVAFASNQGLTADVQREISEALITTYADNHINLENGQDVSPSTGASFFLKCFVAVAFSFIVLVLYIALRFRRIGGWSAGVFALVALMVDVLMVIATFIFFRLSIDANFMAVVLTILGYSINNTIVVYDRIRENRQLYGKKLSYSELVNKSLNQSITRSINTTITTGTAVVIICIVAVVTGVNSIISFAFPMLIGLLSGLFSSMCLSGPLWVAWQEHKLTKKAASKA